MTRAPAGQVSNVLFLCGTMTVFSFVLIFVDPQTTPPHSGFVWSSTVCWSVLSLVFSCEIIAAGTLCDVF